MQTEGKSAESGLDRYEALRLILEGEQHRVVPYSEAVDVGDSLINFFEVLADDSYMEVEQLAQSAI